MSKMKGNELKELFIELRYNNKIAYERLYFKYKKLVYKISFSILKNKNDSEEVVQSVFKKIYEIEKDKLPKDKEINWLYSLTKNEAIMILEKKSKTNYIDISDIYKIEDNDNEINKIIDQNTYNSLINKLNEKEREIISLKIIAGLSFNDIARLLNKPIIIIRWEYYKSLHKH